MRKGKGCEVALSYAIHSELSPFIFLYGQLDQTLQLNQIDPDAEG